jgi:lysozyme
VNLTPFLVNSRYTIPGIRAEVSMWWRFSLIVLLSVWDTIDARAYTTVCPPNVVEGVDVTQSNGPVTWSSVQGSGRGFAFARVSQGDYHTDDAFTTNWPNISAAGMLRSPFHFFDPTIDGVAQANYFLTLLNNAGGLQVRDLPPMLALECPTSSTQSAADGNCEYTGNSGWVPSSTLIQRVFDWLNTVEAATGRKPIIYSYPAWFADVGFTDIRLANYPLFIATFASCASVPSPWTTAAFWQYGSASSIPGTTGSTDLDRFVGSPTELQVFVDTIFADGFEQ